jgi:hypothetical protein
MLLKRIRQKSSFPMSSYFELHHCYTKCAIYYTMFIKIWPQHLSVMMIFGLSLNWFLLQGQGSELHPSANVS